MEPRQKDPLLLAGKVLAILMQTLMAIAAVALIVAIPTMLFMEGRIEMEIATDTAGAVTDLPTMAIVGIMLLALVLVVALFVFFRKLRQIIATVGEGDPFAPENADRLSHMGWLLLGTQLLFLPAAALAVPIARFADNFEEAHFTMDGGIDLTGLMMVVILFILARVFRHGAAMREDLEGTV